MFVDKNRRQNAVRVAICFLVAIPFITIFIPFFVPLLLAVFFALGLEPLWNKLGLHRRQKKFFPVFLLFFWFIFLFIPTVVFGVKVVRVLQEFTAKGTQNSQVFQSLNTLWDKSYMWGLDILHMVNLEADIFPTKDEIVSKVSPIVLVGTTNFLASLPQVGLSLLVFFGGLIVLVPRANKIKNFFIDIELLPKEETEQIISSLKRNCYLVLVSTFLIGILQAFIVALGASIFGFHEFFLIFVVTFILSFIPVIGAAPVSFVLAVTAFVIGQSGNGIGLLVVTGIAGSIDNIIKPYVFSAREEGAHPIMSLIGIIGAIIVFGLPGLLLGPLLLQLGTELLPKLFEKASAATKN